MTGTPDPSTAEATGPGVSAAASTAVPQDSIVFLTHADTDVLSLSSIAGSLDPQVPRVVAFNVGRLKDENEAIALFDAVVPSARIVVVRLHGGTKSLPGFDHLASLMRRRSRWLVALSGISELDPELMAQSNVGIDVCHRAKAYLEAGGPDNYRQCLYYLCDQLLATGIGFDDPAEQPWSGIYRPPIPGATLQDWQASADPNLPTIGVLFYRSYWSAGDTDFVDVLVEAGEALGANVLPVYTCSVKDNAGTDGTPDALRYFIDSGRPTVDAVVHTMSFAMGSSSTDDRAAGDWAVDVLQAMDVPQIQAINAVLAIARTAGSLSIEPWAPAAALGIAIAEPARVTVGVATGPAFTFRYEEHRELLEAAGAQVEFFDPLHDEQLPRDCAARFVGGGFPELFVEGLSANQRLRSEVRAFARAGGPVVGECGGFLYLARATRSFYDAEKP